MQRHGVVGVRRPGAADAEFAFIFKVEVEQDAAVQPVGLDGGSTEQADFFAGGEQRFQRRMAEVFVGKDGKHHGDADAVIGAERGTVGAHPVSINDGTDRVFAEVMHGIAVFLRDHVEVRLQDNAGFVFAPGSCRLAHADVAARIPFGGQPQAGGFVEDVLLDFFFLCRGAGNLRDLVEILPDRAGFKFLDVHQ